MRLSVNQVHVKDLTSITEGVSGIKNINNNSILCDLFIINLIIVRIIITLFSLAN